MPRFKITDPQSGRTVIVSGEAAPTDADADQIFHEAGLRKDASVPGYGFTDELMEQGVMLGYGDEATAGINAGMDTLGHILHGAPTDISGDYDKRLTQRREQKDAWERAHPIAKYVAPILGGLGAVGPDAAAVVAKGAAAVPSLLRTMGQGAKAGAGVGAVAGFGSGEDGLENRLGSAAMGAGLGAAVGAAAPAVAVGVPAIARSGKALLGLSSPETVASNHIATAIGRSGRTPDEVSAAIGDAQGLGVPAVPADTSPSLRRLGRAVETVPGAASDATTRFLEERQTGQAGRVATQIKRALGSDGNALEMSDEIIAKRKAEAAPLYEKSNAPPMPAPSPELESLLKTPAMRQAYGRAKIIAANERVSPTELAVIGHRINPGDFGSYGVAKGPITAEVPTMQSWDYMKRGLDDVLEKYRNPVTGKMQLDEAGRAVLGVKNSLLTELDRINPSYAEARQSFAGHSEMLDALHLGQNFASGDADMVAQRFHSLSEGQQDMFRLGAVNKLRTDINKSPDGSDIVRRLFGTPDRRARIALLFKDPGEFQTFQHIMELERETTKTKNVVSGGSPTGRIAAEQSDLAVGALEDAMRGHGPAAMAMNAARRMLTRSRGINEETAGRIASYLFNPDPKSASQTIDPQTIKDIISASRNRGEAGKTFGRIGSGAIANQQGYQAQ